MLAATKRTLYEEDTPYVGVGLVYKPHYISTEPFSTAYMHLNVWHATGSIAGSPDKLEASPLEATRQRERDLETALDIVDRFHALHLRILHEMGGMRELEQAAICTLMSEFARLQSILCEDITKNLSALHSELEASSEVLSADLLGILNLRPGDPAFFRVRELINKHHQSVTMKVNLPLMELEAAREDLERFLQGRLHELSSALGALEVVEEISQTLSSHACRV